MSAILRFCRIQNNSISRSFTSWAMSRDRSRTPQNTDACLDGNGYRVLIATNSTSRGNAMCTQCRANEATVFAATSRRRFLQSVGGAAAGLAFGSPAFAKDKAVPKPQNDIPPDAALDRLMKGNVRYVDGVSRRHDFKTEREALAGGQNPYAGILSCADSRI